MERSYMIQERNRRFIHYYWVSLLLHALLGFFVIPNSYSFMLIAIGIATLAILFTLRYLKVSQKVIQYVLLFSVNGYILAGVHDSDHIIAIVFFIMPILLASLYYDTLNVMLLIALTGVEVFFFTSVSPFSASSPGDLTDLLALVALLALASCLAFFHSGFTKRVQDTIEQKNESMELALTSKETYLQLFFANAKDAIAVFDLNDRIIDVNPAFEELYGWKREEVIGQIKDFVPPENKQDAEERRLNVVEGKSFSLLETQDIRRDGSYIDVQITLSPILDHSGKVIAMSVIARDNTYRKEAERLSIQTEKLKLAGEIAAGVAHEIRNPMTVISGFVQMMDFEPNHPYHDYTKLMLSELERINLIISEFLILAKPQAVSFRTISLRNTWEDIRNLYGPELNLHGILFSENWKKEDFYINGEENQLKQVFINLMKNAVEATGNNGKITLTAEAAEDNTVAIRLKDDGPGIPEEALAKIFEPFFTTKTSGTGLGLVISQKIIQEHGGTLTIKSKVGKGTEVSIILPQI